MLPNLYVHWNVNPEMCNILGLSVRYYSVLFVCGLALSLFFLVRIFKLEGIPSRKLEILCYYLLAGIFIGARVGHCLFYEPYYYLHHWVEIFLPIRLTRSGYIFTGFRGIASHGAAIGVFIALYIYSARQKMELLKLVDMVVIFAPLCGFFIRFGNLLNSEILGTTTDVKWAFIFERVDTLPRHPVQLYEALAYLSIFLIAFTLYLRRRNSFYPGFIGSTAMFLFFCSRFIVEFFKSHQAVFEEDMSLNMGQILSLPFIVGMLAIMVYTAVRFRSNAKASTSQGEELHN